MAGKQSRTKEVLRGLLPEAAAIPAYNVLLNLKRRRKGLTGGPIRVIRVGQAFDVTVAEETIRIPTLRRSQRYVSGISSKENWLAEQYGCPRYYAPAVGDVIIDIGANVGEFTRACARRGARVFAFEPDPAVFACLQHNVAEFSGVRTFERALWSERAELEFFSAFDTADSSLIRPDADIRGATKVVAVPLDTIPSIAACPRIDLLKMDGEGAEPEILAGARQTLLKTRRVAVDCSPERAGESTSEPVMKLLRAAGFDIVSPTTSGLVFAARA